MLLRLVEGVFNVSKEILIFGTGDLEAQHPVSFHLDTRERPGRNYEICVGLYPPTKRKMGSLEFVRMSDISFIPRFFVWIPHILGSATD